MIYIIITFRNNIKKLKYFIIFICLTLQQHYTGSHISVLICVKQGQATVYHEILKVQPD